MRLRGAALMPRTVATRLYLACALAGIAAASIAGASLHYAHRTHEAVEDFHSQALKGVLAAADLALLLERHRRIVESAPVVMDRQEIDRDRRQSEAIAEEIADILASVGPTSAAEMLDELPILVERSRRVLFLAANYAQQSAMDEAVWYASSAARIEKSIKEYRGANLAAAARDVAAVAEGGRRLTNWVLAATLAIVVVLGPAVWLLSGTVRRLRGITRAMFRLARNETNLPALPTADNDEVGDMARAVSVFRINAEQLMEQRSALEVLNRRFDIALGNMSHGLSMFDANQQLVVSNGRYARIYGLPEELTVPGTRFADILSCYCARGAIGEEQARTAGAVIASELLGRMGASGFTETRRLHDGRLIEVTYCPIEGGGWVDVHEDISEKKAAEERIARLAREDTLTGVANRHAFGEALDCALSKATPHAPLAIHWIDLDRFKEINDVHGHPAGDALLGAVAKRIAGAVRATDFVARLGGDEFAVIQRDVSCSQEAEPLAQRLIQVLSAPFEIMGQAMGIGASIGIALSTETESRDPEVLLRNADIALYQAKAAGRGTFVLYRPEIEAEIRERRVLEADLKRALAKGEFELNYQPIVDLDSREVKCCEALLRWRHPMRGLISPAVFIPLAEELGLISEIGAWVLDRACAEAATWPGGVGVAVNLSASQFETGNLLAVAEGALVRSGLSPSRLELEVTETLLLSDRAETQTVLHRLRDMGIAIALDDFGTGYASLSYLRSFPFDKIKIDQTFVRELPDRPECMAIVTAICEMARSLGIRTVAEGVETLEHVEWVRRAGCSELQGYLFSRPVPAVDLGRVLAGLAEEVKRAA